MISELDRGTSSTVIQVLKQRFSRKGLSELRRTERPSQNRHWQETLEAGHFWQRRFPFVVRSHEKKIEKLKYIHRNPVKRRLVLEPDQWLWSSFRGYAHGERGPVLVNEQRPVELKMRERQTFPAQPSGSPPFENHKGWGSLNLGGAKVTSLLIASRRRKSLCDRLRPQ
jgi:hypothetical protein